jgi:hypothetical protein
MSTNSIQLSSENTSLFSTNLPRAEDEQNAIDLRG